MYETYLFKNWVILQLNIMVQSCFRRKHFFFIIGGKGFWKFFKIILIFSVHFVPGTVPLTRQQGALLPLKRRGNLEAKSLEFLKKLIKH